MREYIDDIGCEILSPDGLVQHSEVLDRYFLVQPPFSHGELKKREFPDAIAILSLEAWASRNRTTVLLISRDKDWQHFANGSDHLAAVADLSIALDFFNGAGSFVVAKCIELLLSSEQSELKVEIEGALHTSIRSLQT